MVHNWFACICFLNLCIISCCTTYFYREMPPQTNSPYQNSLERWRCLTGSYCMPDTERLSRDYNWIYDVGGVLRLPCGLGPAGPVYLKSGEVWLTARPNLIMLNASTFLSLLTGPKEESEKKDVKKTQKGNDSSSVYSDASDNDYDYKPMFGPQTADCANNASSPECDEFLEAQNMTAVKKSPKKEPEKNWCLIVNFYSPYCPFSAQLAPGFNALPRVFPRLHVVAVDATESSRLNNRFGIAGTPSILLWHNGKVIGRYDHTNYMFETLKEFITKTLDLDPTPGSVITESDLKGPLPTDPVKFTDYYLIISWLFIAGCLLYYGSKTTPFIRVVNYLKKVWSEAREANETVEPENLIRPTEPITESEESADESGSMSFRNEQIGESKSKSKDSSQNSSFENSPNFNADMGSHFSLRHRRNYSDQSSSNDET